MQESEYVLKYLMNCVAGKAKFKRFLVLHYTDLNEDGLKKFDSNPDGINLLDFKPKDLTPFGFILFHELDHFKILRDESNHG